MQGRILMSQNMISLFGVVFGFDLELMRTRSLAQNLLLQNLSSKFEFGHQHKVYIGGMYGPCSLSCK